MERNKYPEETVRKILDVSLHLFMTKGYDNTSLQDIIDSLGGLAKGLYHYFKSKEEIFCDFYYNEELCDAFSDALLSL